VGKQKGKRAQKAVTYSILSVTGAVAICCFACFGYGAMVNTLRRYPSFGHAKANRHAYPNGYRHTRAPDGLHSSDADADVNPLADHRHDKLGWRG
jgi:hypothetical protein